MNWLSRRDAEPDGSGVGGHARAERIGRFLRQRANPWFGSSSSGYSLLLVGLSLILISMMLCPSVCSPRSPTSSSLPLVYWIGVGLALAGVGSLASAESKIDNVFALFGFASVTVSPAFFYFSYYSDTAGLLAWAETLDGASHFDVGGSVRGLQWPSVHILMRAVADMLGVPYFATQGIFLVVFAFVLLLAIFLLVRSKWGNRPAIAAILYVIAFWSFLNWQFAPQSVAFGLSLLALAVGLPTAPTRAAVGRSAVLAILLFATVTMHAFVGIWLGSVLLLYSVFLPNRSVFRSAVVVLVVQAAYVMYVADFELAQIVALLGNLESVYRMDAERSTEVLRQYLTGASNMSTNWMLEVTKLISVATMSVALAPALLGWLLLIARRRPATSASARALALAFILTGAAHFAFGSVIDILGMRSVQLVGIGVLWGYSAWRQVGNPKRSASTLLASVVILFFGIVLFRTETTRTTHLTQGQFESLRSVSERLPEYGVTLTGDSYFSNQIRVADPGKRADFKGLDVLPGVAVDNPALDVFLVSNYFRLKSVPQYFAPANRLWSQGTFDISLSDINTLVRQLPAR